MENSELREDAIEEAFMDLVLDRLWKRAETEDRNADPTYNAATVFMLDRRKLRDANFAYFGENANLRGRAGAAEARAQRLSDALAKLRAEIAGLATQYRHNAQGCTRFEVHAAGTWRASARDLDALLRLPAGEGRT